MYADDPANGLFPTSITALYPRMINDATVFLNPREDLYSIKRDAVRAASTHRVFPERLLSEVGYAYEPGLSPVDGLAILAYERIPISGGRNVLFCAGSVEYLEESAFQKRLAEQRVAFAKQSLPPNPPSP
jgi:hypothetical protein